MSAAENRPLTASSRPVERVALPAGPARDLRDAIYQVYAEAGCPRLDELANAVADDDSLSGAPGKDLIGKVISGDTLATQQDCVTVAAALAREAGRADVATLTDKIRHLWVAARTASPADAGEAARPLGQPISACDPIALEVHRAIDVPDGSHQLSPLPAYVERAHDRRLRELADQVLAGASRMITLVGGSSTGKTRACWELAGYVERQQPGRWRLWHPYDPTRPDAAADALDQVGPHTIVWLNEAQLYLAPLGRHLGERIAAGLRTLLTDPGRAPVLVLATMWPGHWTALTSRPAEDRLADPHAPARELLTSTDLDVPDAFSTVDLTGLDTRGDPRLRRRPGEPAPQGDPVYRLADYLEQTGAIQRADVYPPSGFWDAAASVIGDAATLHVLGRAAEQRGRYRHAAGLYRATTDRGDLSALDALTRLLEQAGDPDSAAGLLREAADRGNTYALNHLAFRRERAGDLDGAARLYRQAADHGSTGALSALARLHKQAGDSASAVRLARQATGGRTGVLSSRAQRGERAGDVTGAANRYREAADLGDPGELGARLRQQAADRADTVALINQARLRERAGDSDGAVSAARQAADRGHTGVLSSLALQRERAGDPVGAARLAREAADRGNPIVLSNLARRRERAGDPDGAAGLYRKAADRGNINALGNLARLRERAGDQEGADRIRRFGLDVDGSPAAPWTLC